jgi:hypothetical protein
VFQCKDLRAKETVELLHRRFPFMAKKTPSGMPFLSYKVNEDGSEDLVLTEFD